jgi:hypothetical protein
MEFRLHFAIVEELQENPDAAGTATRVVVIRESKNSGLALEEATAGFHPLE